MKKVYIFLSVVLFFLSVNISQSAQKSSSVNKMGVLYGFKKKPNTTGYVLDKLLRKAGYTLISTKDKYVNEALRSKAPALHKDIKKDSLTQAVQSIIGKDFDVYIDNITKKIALKIKKEYKPTFFLNRGYELRISRPLQAEGVTRVSIKNLLNSISRDKICYTINVKDRIEAIAGSKKQSDSLSLKNRKVFYVVPGDTIRETISRWASYSGYNTYYLASKDLKVKSLAIYYGEFIDKNGPLSALLENLSSIGINMSANFYTNNTLTLEDNYYRPVLLSGVEND